MNRSVLSFLSFLLLVGLTLATWRFSEGAMGTSAIAGLAIVKVAIIGGVFLELDRSWPVWAGLAGVLTVVVSVGSALLTGG